MFRRILHHSQGEILSLAYGNVVTLFLPADLQDALKHVAQI